MMTKRFMWLQTYHKLSADLWGKPLNTPLHRNGAKEWQSQARKDSGTAGSGRGFLGSFGSRGSFAAPLGLRRRGGSFTNQLGGHDTGNKELGTMVVKIHGSALLVGSGDDSQAVHFMFDGLTFLHYLHNVLLDHSVSNFDSNLLVREPRQRPGLPENRLEACNVLCLKA